MADPLGQTAPHSLVVASYFDGQAHHDRGPYRIRFEGDTIRSIEAVSPGTAVDAAFVMPSLVEGHAHLFLDGGVTDLAERSAYMKAELPEMMATARRSLAALRDCGIGLVRDVGDRHGINHAMRAECQHQDGVKVRSCGIALRRPGRYGGFMGREVADDDAVLRAVDELAVQSDDIKVLLTGIIDFNKGLVPGSPQFDAPVLRRVVERARGHGRPTLAHCSGLAGLEVAVAAGIESIEHGFFMTRDILSRMADQGIAWVPTVSPVWFQGAEPGHVGWQETALAHIRDILASHREHMAMAHQMGVPLVVGSDAGSHGVRHGHAVQDEIRFMLDAGIDLASVLRSATSLPRRLWRADANDIAAGSAPDMLALPGSPFDDVTALGRPVAVGQGRRLARTLTSRLIAS